MTLDGSGRKWWSPFYGKLDRDVPQRLERLAFGALWCEGDESSPSDTLLFAEESFDDRLSLAEVRTGQALRRIEVAHGEFVLEFPYNSSLVAAVKELPQRDRRWDKDSSTWRLQPTKPVLAWIQSFLIKQHGFGVSSDATALLSGQ